MKKFTNKNIKKEYRKIFFNIGIAVILILIAGVFKYLEIKKTKEDNKGATDLNSIIMNETMQDDKKTYLDASSIPYKFAIYDDTTDSYYFVSDGTYLYIVYMSEADFNKLNTDEIHNKAMRIDGITKYTTDDIKKIAVESYNDNMENEEDKITMGQFNDYFGAIYLDMTSMSTQTANTYFIFFFTFLIFGGFLLLTHVIHLYNYLHYIKSLDEYDFSNLEKELNDENSFYYEKAHLYLTNHYIVNFKGRLNTIKYSDILWMYPFEQRRNGIKTSQSIKVLTKDGKTYTIATIDVVTKKKQEIYREIWDTIISKNSNMLLGYTKENISNMKEKVKEIKQTKGY